MNNQFGFKLPILYQIILVIIMAAFLGLLIGISFPDADQLSAADDAVTASSLSTDNVLDSGHDQGVWAPLPNISYTSVFQTTVSTSITFSDKNKVNLDLSFLGNFLC